MKNVPNLRFKEFSGEWKTCLLGKSIVLYDKDRKPIKEQERISGEYAYYGATGIIDYIDDYIFEGEYLLLGEDGANIVTRSAPLIYKTSGKFWVNNHAHIFKPKKDFNIDFMKQRLELINYVPYNTGTAQPKLNADSIKSIPFKAPEKEEQEKIASFFSLIDKKIELQTEKVEELKNYKKGIMQKIFSQELRFKDENGNEFPHWEENKLGDICDITTGKLDANAMVEGGMYRFYTCAKEYFQIDKYAFDTEALLISGNGANVGYIHYYNGKFNAYQRTYVLTNFKENILFIKYYLNKNLKRRILEEKNEGNTPYIVLSTLSDMPVKLPCSDEQEKISQFLTPLELKIEKEEMKLDYYQKYKKGLLQQMFI